MKKGNQSSINIKTPGKPNKLASLVKICWGRGLAPYQFYQQKKLKGKKYVL
jgi:hypothetical protein